MKLTLNLTTVLLLLSLTACVHVDSLEPAIPKDAASPDTGAKRTAMSEVMSSAQKEALLKERIGGAWSAFLKEDYVAAYEFFDPFFRARTSQETYISWMGKIKYHTFEIKDIKVTGNVAKVSVGIVYSVSKVKIKTQEISAPETPSDVDETWLYVYDNWYKEYYMASLESGVARY